jgi:hypothetical protein
MMIETKAVQASQPTTALTRLLSRFCGIMPLTNPNAKSQNETTVTGRDELRKAITDSLTQFTDDELALIWAWWKNRKADPDSRHVDIQK